MVLLIKRRYLGAIVLLVAAGVGLAAYSWSRGERSARGVFSWVVAYRVIVVDPGHGGVDPGAVGHSGTLEKEVTLAIGLRLKEILEQAGAVVVMTRKEDIDLGSPGKSLSARKKEDLDRRIQLVRECRGDIYLGIQANAFGTRWTGAQTFYYPESRESRRLAEAVQGGLKRVLGNTRREAKPLDIYVLRHLTVPAVLIEVGFLSNPLEERLLTDPEYQKKVALAIYSGVLEYLAAAGF